MFGFSIQEIFPHIYHLHFESAYDLAMHFLRFSEYYESPKYYKKIFTLIDYMEWYAQERGEGSFSYADDWRGFNVPSWALRQVRKADIPDLNKYDRRMFMLIDWTEEREFPSDYYFIGTSTEGCQKNTNDVIGHEVAHAFYTVDSEYRREVDNLLAQWNTEPGHRREELGSAREALKLMGYHGTTIDDEIHAYCATGLCNDLKGVVSKQEMKPFQKLFKETKERCTSEK